MSASDKRFIFCVHAHQPVGNFGHVFAEAYDRCYRPFFEVLERHPSVPVVCHLSGSLIDWLEAERPAFIEKLQALHSRGQLEFLGGGYYEPIYGAIPEKDLRGQIAMMRGKIAELFGAEPEGAWLTERVWDPHLVGTLRRAGVGYTIVDDFHLEKAGLKNAMGGSYLAGNGDGTTLEVFASVKALRYMIPFRRPEDTIRFIHSAKPGPGEAVVFADDCEKFGLWPGTHRWVYQQNWLERFFGLLEKDRRILMGTFTQFRARGPRAGRAVNIPHSSYGEMMEWSGGSFYNFFEKYPESRYMRDRMWGVSRAIDAMGSLNGSSAAYREAKALLYKAQCNCAYWHGVFGGLYLHHLRSAVFENLIRADRVVEDHEKIKKTDPPQVFRRERLESGDRWVVSQDRAVSFFNPAYGAALEELDFLPCSANLLCTLQRRPEAYHATLRNGHSVFDGTKPFSIHAMLGSKEKGLENHLFYDPARRLSFIDHFFEEPATLEEFRRAECREAGDFVGQPYRSILKNQAAVPWLHFSRDGRLDLGGRKRDLHLSKDVFPAGGAAIEVRYELKNTGSSPVGFVFGVEFNFSIGDEAAKSGVEQDGIRDWVFRDSWRGLSIRVAASRETDFLCVPVETVSGSESGLERTTQGLSALFQRRWQLAPGTAEEIVFRVEVETDRAYQEKNKN